MIGRVNIDKSQNSQNFQNTINCIQIGRQLLLHHSEIRPITSTDLNFFESSIRISTHIWDAEVRDAVCSQLLLLKALGIGKRKKRQNFSNKITNILNNYFINHLSKPYPDEQTKLALAEQCGITLAQVSNWFGNKRIRYRKAQNKATKAAR
uniref:Homeobox domain-containing protein n=1 Tax=Meloidogyne incognita TaxID=6306 RepID=A0A914L3N7_MELIC